MSRTTVIHLIDTDGPGGAETVFLDLIRHLPANRYASIPVVSGAGWLHHSLVECGMTPIVLPATGGFRYLKQLAEIVRSVRADVVHSHLLGSVLYGSLAARLTRAAAVGTFHGPADFPADDPHRAARFKLISWSANAIVFVSESLRDFVMTSTTMRPRLTRVIHNGVDLSKYATAVPASLREQLGIDSSTTLLGCLGNVRAPKGYDYLLEALARLPESLPPWHVAVVGATDDTSIFEALRRKQEELGLDSRVTFVGFRTDAANVLRSFDIFVLPSVTEGFSLATVQALASSLPVVATRSGGPEEIVSQTGSALLVPPRDPQALAAALERVISDPELRRQMAASARGSGVTRFSLETMITAYTDLYDHISR